MGKSSSPVVSPAERLNRPQRIGVLGHRGVGKTTLLTMLYREAVGGRLPGLRLAAADAQTAGYLGDKVLQLEAGEVLPATLAETELRFQLYHKGARIELVFRDYQGEHVALGRREPIRDFLRDCDAVWVCFDPAVLASARDRLGGQQEVEQIIEDYLAVEPIRALHRPMAIIVTKADLLSNQASGECEPPDVTALVEANLGMTLHALKQHCPQNALFAVSSLGPPSDGASSEERLHPRDLDRPLLWLAEALQAQDEARVNHLFGDSGVKLSVLRQAVGAFGHRYPEAKRLPEYRRQLRERLSRRRRRFALAGVAALLCGFLGLWTWDRVLYARAMSGNEADPVAARQRLESYNSWPLSIGSKDSLTEKLRELDGQIQQREREDGLAELNRRAADAAADPREVWKQFQAYHAKYPDVDGLKSIQEKIAARLFDLRTVEAQKALDELVKSESALPADRAAARKMLEELAGRANRLLAEHANVPPESEIRLRRDSYLMRIDEGDFEEAKAYSNKEPLNFQTRRERYQAYLDRHPQGAYVKDARAAIDEVEGAWDRHDYRALRDLFWEKSHETKELIARSEQYLQVHARGKYRDAARDLIDWCERMRGEREFTVKAVRGDFSGELSRWFTRGPDLAVVIEVGGVKYGPSPIVKNKYSPEWDYEFPRPIKWRAGDKVRIKVVDYDYFDKTVLDHQSTDDDMLSIRLLAGELTVSNEQGTHTLLFESDFRMPKLPKVE